VLGDLVLGDLVLGDLVLGDADGSGSREVVVPDRSTGRGQP
jgi:hypothetical protein